jgi:hypothetical protein
MDITLSNVLGLNLIQHQRDSHNYYTTLIVTTEKGEVRIELFSKQGIPFILGDKDD